MLFKGRLQLKSKRFLYNSRAFAKFVVKSTNLYPFIIIPTIQLVNHVSQVSLKTSSTYRPPNKRTLNQFSDSSIQLKQIAPSFVSTKSAQIKQFRSFKKRINSPYPNQLTLNQNVLIQTDQKTFFTITTSYLTQSRKDVIRVMQNLQIK